jgi:SAM-dependent methyltransferase
MTDARDVTLEKMYNYHPCVCCGGTDFGRLFAAPDFDTGKVSFQLLRCISCNLVRTEPILSDDDLETYYSLPYYGSGKTKFVGLAETLTYVFNYIRASSILSHVHSHRDFPERPTTRILDIGCGRGNLLKILKQKGFDCYGIERANFPRNDEADNIHMYRQKIEDVGFSENFFDVVLIWHVLEHIDDPISMIRETTRILRPGGLLAIAVPNFGCNQARFFRGSWFHLDLPRHAHHFTKDVLLGFLKDNGFNIIRNHTFSIEQNLFGFIQSFFNKIVPFAKPNQFYSLLKKRQNFSSTFSFLLWTALAILIFPLAFFEYLISGVLGRGATIIIYAKKC